MVVLLVASLTVGTTTALAQDESPSVDLTGTSINVDAGETSTVTAEYQFTVASAGSGDSALTSIGGTLWKMPDRDVGEITASVNGESVDATVTEQSEHLGVSVPVEGVSSGETVTVTLEYQVSGPAGELRAPLWVPEYSTPGQANVVDMTVTLPDGTTSEGDTFPNAEVVDGNTAEYELLHVPGFIKMNYGETGTGFFTSDVVYSILGVVLIVGFIVGGLAIDRKTA